MKTGVTVSWESQAQGVWKRKTGNVVAEVPAGQSAMEKLPEGVKKSHIKFDKDKSSVDRVLVAVDGGRYGGITHYYCPRYSILE